MSAPRSSRNYPDWFIDLAMEFNEISEKTLTFPSPKVARETRRLLYGFRGALSRDLPGRYKNFQTIRIAIQGNTLHIMNMNLYLPPPPEMSK